MSKTEKFIDALKGNLKDKRRDYPQIIPGTVVELADSTCTVKLVHDGLEHDDVRYSATESSSDGLIVKPKVGSSVLVGLIGSNLNSMFLVSCDELESVQLEIGNTKVFADKDGIEMNGGNNGGIVISKKVADELNAVIQDLNTLKTLITGWVPVLQDGGGALKTALSTWGAQNLSSTVEATLENDKITH